MSYIERYSAHNYEPDATGRCQWGWVDSSGRNRICNSTQRSSVMHYDLEADFRQLHWHGGGDCMCFEDPEGPDYYTAMMDYVKSHQR